MLPNISVSCRCGGMPANVQHYRMLISDELSEELTQLAQELRDVGNGVIGAGDAHLIMSSRDDIGVELRDERRERRW